MRSQFPFICAFVARAARNSRHTNETCRFVRFPTDDRHPSPGPFPADRRSRTLVLYSFDLYSPYLFLLYLPACKRKLTKRNARVTTQLQRARARSTSFATAFSTGKAHFNVQMLTKLSANDYTRNVFIQSNRPDDDCYPVTVDGDIIKRCTWTCGRHCANSPALNCLTSPHSDRRLQQFVGQVRAVACVLRAVGRVRCNTRYVLT